MFEKGKKYKIQMSQQGHIDYVGQIMNQDSNFITLQNDGETPIMINLRHIKVIREMEE